MVRLSASGCNIKSRYLTLPLHKMHAACFSQKKDPEQIKRTMFAENQQSSEFMD